MGIYPPALQNMQMLFYPVIVFGLSGVIDFWGCGVWYRCCWSEHIIVCIFILIFPFFVV